MTNVTLTIGGITIPADGVEIRTAVNPPEPSEGKKEGDKTDDRLDAMMYAVQQFSRSAVVLGQLMARDLSPIVRALSVALPSPGRMRRELYYSGTIWSDPDGRWRMEGYDEDLIWFRDLLAFRYGAAVGPVLQHPHPRFHLDLTQMYACRAALRPEAPDPWAETDEACIRRWAHMIEVTPQQFPP